MLCPKCKSDIDADSWYCDQCGEMIMICPKCNAPRKGKRCTQCGTLLVAAKDGAPAAQPQPQTPPVQPQPAQPQPAQQPQTPPQTPPATGPAGLPPLTGFGNAAKNSSAPQQAPEPAPAAPATPPQNPSGTMRPKPAGPTRMVSVDDPQRVVVFRNGAIIGRTTGDYLDVFSDNGYTSGRHAQLQQAGDDWLLIDLGSTNGTTIDNMTLTPNQGYPLKAGQTVEIGYKKFKVQ